MAALTAGEVVNRIKAVMAVQGVSWSDASTRDRFKFGGPDTVVTGIATTFMGTFEAITRASERGLNLIIPHEDTYWNDADNTLIAEADPLVYRNEDRFHDGAPHRRSSGSTITCTGSVPTSRSRAPRARSASTRPPRRRRTRTGSSFPKRRSASWRRGSRRSVVTTRSASSATRREGQPDCHRRGHGDPGGECS